MAIFMCQIVRMVKNEVKIKKTSKLSKKTIAEPASSTPSASFRFGEDVMAKLKTICKLTNKKMAEVMRELIEDQFRKQIDGDSKKVQQLYNDAIEELRRIQSRK